MPMPTDDQLKQLVKDLNELEALKAAPTPTSTGEARVAVEQPKGVLGKAVAAAGMFFTKAKDPATERQEKIAALEGKVNGMFDSIARELQGESDKKSPAELSGEFAGKVGSRIDTLFPGERRTGGMSMMAAAPKEGAKVFSAFCARIGAPTTLEEMSRQGPGMRGGG